MEKEPEYLKELNDPQKKAVLQTEGPVMIIAGAGSGKTRVLTYRIAHLMQMGVDPFNIIALTFTNKAAREMRERIEKLVGPEARNLWMGTFHSIFARILRAEADKLGYPSNFTIYDTTDSRSLIKIILKEMGLDDKVYKPSMIHSRISAAKNNLITHNKYEANSELTSYDESTGRPKISYIYREYAERCYRAGAMDFDDLLLKTHELFSKHVDVLNKYQQLYKYVMVDEYQDTNHCQYMIVKKLAAVYENICVVGDDAQSIYSFRGATIRNILSFEKDYPDLNVFKLEQNYRSTKNIVEAAGHVIKNNKDQLQKTVWTSNESGELIRVMRAITDNEEGRLIAQAIFEEKMKSQAYNYEFAILYRTNAQSRSLEEALRKINIPYRIYGGLSFYQRKEIKDVLAYLKLTVNHKDEEALRRIINYPARGIGKTTLERMTVLASENKMSYWDVISKAKEFPELSSAANKLTDFVTMIKSFATMLENQDAYELASFIAKSTQLLKTLNEDKTVEGISKYENVVELLNGIKEFVEDDTSELDKTLGVYLQDIALVTDADQDDGDKDKVSLMTIHSAKGLEFPYVFVSGMEENLFPSQMALGSRNELEEERRLFYVALTRAEKKLNLSFATSRFRFGQLLPCEPSRFIEEIDEKFLKFDRNPNKKNISYGQEAPSNRFQRTGTYGRNISTSRHNAKPIAGGRGIIPKSKPAAIPDFVPEDTTGLQESMIIEHQRFGKGTVVKIEGNEDGRKATIEFDEYGKKQLVLKFAKLRILS